MKRKNLLKKWIAVALTAAMTATSSGVMTLAADFTSDASDGFMSEGDVADAAEATYVEEAPQETPQENPDSFQSEDVFTEDVDAPAFDDGVDAIIPDPTAAEATAVFQFKLAEKKAAGSEDGGFTNGEEPSEEGTDFGDSGTDEPDPEGNVLKELVLTDAVLAELPFTRAIPEGAETYAFTMDDLGDAFLQAIEEGLLDESQEYAPCWSDLNTEEGDETTIEAEAAAPVTISVWLLPGTEISTYDAGSVAWEWEGNGRQTSARQKMNSDGAFTDPGSQAVWFFSSDNAQESFNRVNDTYQDDLGIEGHGNPVNKGIMLYSSVDGNIRQTGKSGEFWINWENQYRENQIEIGSDQVMGDGYTDGSYTVVGWGGDFRGDAGKTKLRLRVRDSGGGTIRDAMSHLTIYLVGTGGVLVDKVWLKDSGNNQDVDSLYIVDQNPDTPEIDTDENGYYVFEARLNGESGIQGLKMAFNRFSETWGEDKDTHHSGTLVVGDVEIQLNENEWVDYGPFDYYDQENGNGDYYNNGYVNPARPGFRPFLRSAHQAADLGDGSTSGYNQSSGPQNKYDWHMWTMSTSDGNIVSNAYSNVEALQIKYSNTKLPGSGGDGGRDYLHRTYTRLIRDEDRTGEWLAITLGGEDVDINTKVQLVSNGAYVTDDQVDIVKEIALSEFRTEKTDDENKKVTADTFRDLKYHTIYYHLKPGITFKSVYFNFRDVEDVVGDASRYLYVTEIYLLAPSATIEKSVDKENAHAGDAVTYTLKITNDGELPVTSAMVTDVIPTDYDIDKVTANDNGVIDKDSRTVTWTISELQPGEETTVSFSAVVSDGYTGIITNKASITAINDKTFEPDSYIWSNEVKTVVQDYTLDNYVFYAEAGMTTDLPIALGQTERIDTIDIPKTEQHVITVPFTGDGQPSSAEITDVTIPAGAAVRLNGPGSGGFVIKNIQIGSQTFTLDRDHLNSDFTADGELIYHCKDNQPEGDVWDDPQFTGYISSLGTTTITLQNVSAIENGNVKIELDQIYNTAKAFTLSIITSETGEQPSGVLVNDTFGEIPIFSNEGATIAANGAAGQNSGTLKYTSNKTGKDTFTVSVKPGGVETNVKAVNVTVYNYQVKDHVYVLDYGLPVDLTDKTGSGLYDDAVLKLVDEDAGDATVYALSGVKGEKRNTDTSADPGDYTTPYGATELTEGMGTVTANENTVTYTPGKFMSDVDTFYYGVQVFKQGDTARLSAKTATPVMEGEVKVMPASIVYYEDNFASSGTAANGADGKNGIIYSGQVGENTQDVSFKQSNDQDELYGFDEAYRGGIEDSDNGSTEMTAPGDAGNGSQATFTFKGTGFDIVGRTTGTSAGIVYRIKDTSTNKVIKFGVVDTYYANGDLYQIPVIHEDLKAYGEYEVMLIISNTGRSDFLNFFLDGIRIYNPMGTEGNEAYIDNEKGAVITKVGDMLLGDGTISESGVVGEDGAEITSVSIPGSQAALLDVFEDGSITFSKLGYTWTEDVYKPNSVSTNGNSILQYLHAGPNNEVYIDESAAIAFVAEQTGEAGTLQIEVKQVNILNRGTPGKGECPLQIWNGRVFVNAENQIDTATGMYYEIPVSNCVALSDGKYLVVIRGGETSTSTSTLAFSNLKTKGYTITNALEDKDARDALGIEAAGEQEAVMSDFKMLGTAKVRRGGIARYTVTTTKEIEDYQKNFKLFYVNAAGEETAIPVTVTKSETETIYDLNFKAPKIAGSYPLRLYYVENGVQSKEFIEAALKVSK